MIGGITKGSDFAGCVRYALALDEPGKEARLLYSEGVLTDTPQDIIDGFECQRHLNSRVRHWCGHISLSYSPKDTERMTDEFMVKLALEYMDKMGIKNTQFIIARHLDKEHPHCHIVYNRIDNDGKCVSDSFEYFRNNTICEEMKKKYGLTFGENKDNVKTQRLKGRSNTRQEIYLACKPLSEPPKTGFLFSVNLLRKVSPSGRNSDVALQVLKVCRTSRMVRNSRHRKLTGTDDVPMLPSVRHLIGTKTEKRNLNLQLRNQRQRPSKKLFRPVPKLPKTLATHSEDYSKSDPAMIPKKRLSSAK